MGPPTVPNCLPDGWAVDEQLLGRSEIGSLWQVNPVEALQRLGGIAAYGELIGPTTRQQLRTAVASGLVTKLRHDRYALVNTDAHRAAAVAAGGVLSHLSAAVAWGWKVQHEPTCPWVTVPRNRRRPQGKLEVRWADVPDSDVANHVTRPARTVVDCAKALPFSEALSIADSALRSEEVDRHQLLLAAQASSRVGRPRAIEVIDAADAGAANPFESAIRSVALRVPGLSVETQGEIDGVGFVDLLDRRLGIVVEGDSFEFHGKLHGLRRDVKRYTALARRGYVVVRFLWEEAMFDQTYVHAALVDAVGHRRSGMWAAGATGTTANPTVW